LSGGAPNAEATRVVGGRLQDVLEQTHRRAAAFDPHEVSALRGSGCAAAGSGSTQATTSERVEVRQRQRRSDGEERTSEVDLRAERSHQAWRVGAAEAEPPWDDLQLHEELSPQAAWEWMRAHPWQALAMGAAAAVLATRNVRAVIGFVRLLTR
jgi:hypothetical protein